MEDKKKKKSFLKFILDGKYLVFAFVFGLVLGLGIMALSVPKQIATLSDGSTSIALWNEGSLSANELYDALKNNSNITVALNLIDSKLLEKDYPYEKYKETNYEKGTELINYYKENYNITEEDFLKSYGFKDLDSFLEYLIIDTRRYDYFKDTIKSKITESDKKKFYKNNVFGSVETKYIAVDIDDSSKDDEKLITEIQNKINKGSSYDDIVKEYSSKITNDDLGSINWNDGMDTSYIKELLKLKDNSHNKKYVKTDIYGYTIIFRGESKEKPDYESVKEEIVNEIFKEKDNDPKVFESTLINMRKSNGLEFTDSTMNLLYKEYVKSYK